MLSAVWLVECIGQTRVGFLASRVSNATYYGAGRIEHSTSRFSRSSNYIPHRIKGWRKGRLSEAGP